MYLVSIYNSFILNVFLTFLLFLTFIYLVIREDQGAVHVRKDMLKTCWPSHAEEPNMVKQFGESFLADLVHIVFIYAFFFIWCKYQEALCKFSLACFFLFFFCVAAVVTQVNTANNIQYLWLFLDIQIKYTWKSIIVPENTVLYTRPILHFSIDKYIFFMATTTRNIGLFFRFVGS